MPGKSYLRKKRKFNNKGNNGPPNGPPAKKSASTAKKSPKPAAAAPQKPAAAATKPLRSATLNESLKKQLEQQTKELEDWKQKALEYELGLKHKADKVKLLKPTGEDKNVLLALKNGLVQDVYN